MTRFRLHPNNILFYVVHCIEWGKKITWTEMCNVVGSLILKMSIMTENDFEEFYKIPRERNDNETSQM